MKPQKTIENYGVVLRPMSAADLERVRRWRNAPHVKRNMQFQGYIEPEAQKSWWKSLHPFHNFYYLIELQGKAIGVVHAKEIDWENACAETGIFIGVRSFLGHFVAVQAVLALMDELFGYYALKKLKAKQKADSEKVLEFNFRLGYQIVKEQEGFAFLEVGAEEYYAKASQLRTLAARLGKSAE